ncbi:hypothetical protein V8E54_009336 [Elaphomyces granulatus]
MPLNNVDHYDTLNKVVEDFLLEHSPTFKELLALRNKGWENPNGDDFFKKQRKNADQGDRKSKRYFFEMMKRMAGEMNNATEALVDLRAQEGAWKLLDLCMAPGGFSQFLLELHPTGKVCGISLPLSKGGHQMLLNLRDPRVTVEFLDITMLSSEMFSPEAGITTIPPGHPDAGDFLDVRPYHSEVFDLVICDGQVLRTHERLAYREPVEHTRLLMSQLAIGLSRIKPGGSMIVLLHKVDHWDSLTLLETFNEFSRIQLFKPEKCHAIRSSFYLIAKDVQPQSPHAVSAVASWKRSWMSATIEACRQEPPTTEHITAVLSRFGKHYLRLGTPIWAVQRDALGRSSICQDVGDSQRKSFRASS